MPTSKNSFGHNIPKISELLSYGRMTNVISVTLKRIMLHLGLSENQGSDLTLDILDAAKTFQAESEYERVIHGRLEEAKLLNTLPLKLLGRSELIFNQIIPLLKKGEILDLGCGDGKVGASIAKTGCEVTLCDVYEHPNISSLPLKFVKYSQLSPLPFDSNTVDTVLILTVLHHCDNPLEIIKEVKRILTPGGRAVIIESVFGITSMANDLSQTEENLHFLSLSSEEQRLSNIFFDHFYNRIIHFSNDPEKKVNVPFNFDTPENWKKHFEVNGLKQTSLIHLGIDQPVVPEYHTLHGCDKVVP